MDRKWFINWYILSVILFKMKCPDGIPSVDRINSYPSYKMGHVQILDLRENNGRHKGNLSDDAVRFIRRNTHLGLRTLAAMFNKAKPVISRIINYKTYKYVPN